MKQTAVEWLESELNIWQTIADEDTNATLDVVRGWIDKLKAMEKEQKIAFGKKCFYKGFEKAENDDANCFTAWREEANELLNFKSE